MGGGGGGGGSTVKYQCSYKEHEHFDDIIFFLGKFYYVHILNA